MKASVIITFDFELGWGAINNGKWMQREKSGVYSRLRTILPKLLGVFKDLEIYSTWGIVGCMCEAPGQQDLMHLDFEMKSRILTAQKQAKQETFDGRDLIEHLNSSSKYCSFCSHSYSHTRVDELASNDKAFEREIILFENAMEGMTYEKKFIFPQNIEGGFNVLEYLGYHKVRGAEVYQNDNKHLFKKFRNHVLLSPRLSESIQVTPYLVKETGSIFYNARNSKWRRSLVQYRCWRGLKNILRFGGKLHIYNHPFNLAEDKYLYKSYIKLLNNIARFRDKGLLQIDKF